MTFRPDIQALRAIAVGAVLLFHIFPDFLPGGYIGVDAFFVISGYLMTAILLREAESTGRISLLGFYARRARRLLPAATATLVAVALAATMLPETRWEETGWDIIASALYVENWRLAWLAVDYLGAEAAPSPVQHFWSLSIEEQFYIVWPLLILASLGIAALVGSNFRRILFFTIVTLVIFSFIASIIVTPSDPEIAYFATYTRIWELALGGLLAFLGPVTLGHRTRETVKVAALAAISAAAILFSKTTAFPGYIAAIPTLATALVIIAGSGDSSSTLSRLLEARPIQYLGGTSYSIYLWHWPIVFFYLALIPRTNLSILEGLGIIGLTLLVAHFSKTLIEDRFRRPRPGSATPARVLTLGALSAVAASCLAAFLLILIANHPLLQNVANGRPKLIAYTPALSAVRKDLPEIYTNECHISTKEMEPKPCEYGHPNADFDVVLAGDSHAAQWAPALINIAERRHWRLRIFTKTSCPLLTEMVILRGGKKAYEACLEWSKRVLELLKKTPPDLVIVSNSRTLRLYGDASPERMSRALAKTWRELRATGSSIILLQDTPRFSFDLSECLSRRPDCSAGPHDVVLHDPTPIALKLEPDVYVIDMTDAICPKERCPADMDKIIVWRDKHHLTATFSKSLAPILDQRISAVLSVAARR